MTATVGLASDTDTHCHRGVCHFRHTNHHGTECCLMEAVRNRWVDPSAVNYCKDPAARKYIDHFHWVTLMQRMKTKKHK